jgi:hypothetical protein
VSAYKGLYERMGLKWPSPSPTTTKKAKKTSQQDVLVSRASTELLRELEETLEFRVRLKEGEPASEAQQTRFTKLHIEDLRSDDSTEEWEESINCLLCDTAVA